MSLINNRSFILDDEEDKDIEEYVLPSIVTSKPEVIPIKKSLAISSALHPAAVLLIWLITVALALMGINLSLFKKPQAQLKKDIEFVLVDKEAKPRDPNTRNRADMNSRSGGINDPKRKVSMPSPAPSKPAKPSAAAKSANKIIKQQQKQIAQQAKAPAKKPAQQAPAPKKSTQQQTAQNKPSPAKPAPPTARPSSRPISAPAPTPKPSSSFTVPAPKGAPVGKTLSTGPVGGTSAPAGSKSGSASSGSGSKGSSYAPRPSLSPSASGGSGQLARGSNGSGNVGNPGGGGGAPGIDALREPDFGPYMRELQRRIKLNWDPPKGNESKRVVLLFKIARDGRLLSCKVQKSSGMPSADQAALKAVELTAPFRPLPGDFKGQSIDIQFTFDYNVFNASRY
ncbi:MAG: hypothetical protein BHW62_07775 [Acinetobacter sp. CAG:196_36_41]|nr:MAG: hypothetical protein BHW62_07775 [Acinetobacter sp. CAG:196_36_41]